jgi:hypothetical protein
MTLDARSMGGTADSPVMDLRSLLEDLGKDGGWITPSVYDTAQVLRFWPPREVEPALEWLLSQQRPDGGWGPPSAPLTRDLPTLAAVLALHAHQHRLPVRDSVQAGVAFLQQQSSQWAAPLPEALPAGVELILPWLIEQAAAQGLPLPRAPYAALLALGNRRRQRIAWQPLGIGTPATHSWEAWGTRADPLALDGSGGVGHSPAATAAWLQAAQGERRQESARVRAECYLVQAAAATRAGIPGVVPTVWPVDRFEAASALFALLLAGLLDDPRFTPVVTPQLDLLARGLRPAGLGASDCFAPDAADTAAALAVLRSAGRPVELSVLTPFERERHFCTWPGELQPSVSVNARVAFARLLCGAGTPRVQEFLTERQAPDGRWGSDKWNLSWLHTTLIVLLSRGDPAATGSRDAAVASVLAHQRDDGAWACGEQASALETAYAVLALRWIERYGWGNRDVASALQRGQQWLLRRYQPFQLGVEPRWLAKEPYAVPRADRAFELSALLAGRLDGGRSLPS